MNYEYNLIYNGTNRVESDGHIWKIGVIEFFDKSIVE